MNELPSLEILGEAAHDRYLAGEPGPMLGRVDGGCRLAWQDGRSKLMGNEAPAAAGCIAA